MNEQLIAASRQALKALQSVYLSARNEAHYDAITALRTAIEAAEKQEPVAWMDALKDAFFEGFTSVETYNDTLLNSPEEAWAKYKPPVTQPAASVQQESVGRVVSANCEYATVQWQRQTSEVGGGDPKNSRSWPIAGDAVYTTPPAAPVQEPVAGKRLELIGHADLAINNIYVFNGYGEEVPDGRTPIYAGYPAPAAQRRWVGLTYAEKDELRYSHMTSAEFIDAIEQRLKEKNT